MKYQVLIKYGTGEVREYLCDEEDSSVLYRILNDWHSGVSNSITIPNQYPIHFQLYKLVCSHMVIERRVWTKGSKRGWKLLESKEFLV